MLSYFKSLPQLKKKKGERAAGIRSLHLLTRGDVEIRLDSCFKQEHTWLSTVNWNQGAQCQDFPADTRHWTVNSAPCDGIEVEHNVAGFRCVLILSCHFTLQIKPYARNHFTQTFLLTTAGSHDFQGDWQLLLFIRGISQSITVKAWQFVEHWNDSTVLEPNSACPPSFLFISCLFLGEETASQHCCLLNPVIVRSHPSWNSKDISKNHEGDMEWIGNKQRMQITFYSGGHLNLHQLYLNHLFFALCKLKKKNEIKH